MIAWLRSSRDALPAAANTQVDGDDWPGLVAAGGELTPARLREAYGKGIFPWYSQGQPVLWWSPDPRMVLLPAEFSCPRSLMKTLRRFVATPQAEIRIDSAFDRVIEACASAPRPGQDGTWIVAEMVAAYQRWHRDEGAVHSFEAWVDGELVGGLYGVALGHMFFGESMFARRSDASKIALAALVAFCRRNRIVTIDCQQRTAHLASFGGRELPRDEFEQRLRHGTDDDTPIDWTYDLSMWTSIGVAVSERAGDAAARGPA